VSIALVGDSLVNWNATIIGPADTPYVGGKFVVNIDFSDNYPFKAPKVLFKTKIFHPNIKQDTGEICAQAIENNWVPTLNARFVIESLVTLLKNPNADHPLEAEIAEVFQKDYKGFCTKAKEFTASYAK
jgi:ubiquitin-conjugating enzyme E2 D/E